MTVALTNKQLDAARKVMNGQRNVGGFVPGRNLRDLLGTSAAASTKQDFNFDFGYKLDIDFYDLYQLYKRNGVAKAVVNKTVSKTWETMPELVHRDEDADTQTGMEKEIAKRFSKIRFWQQLAETDKRGLVGEFSGVIFRFADDGDFRDPVESVPGGIDGLVGLIPFWEGQMSVSQWDQDRKSETFGEPVMFTFNENSVDSDEGKTQAFQVHRDRVYVWSRDRTTHNDSDLEASHNALVDMIKIRGAGAEGFWKNAKSQPVLEANENVNFQELAAVLGVEELDQLPDALDAVVEDWNLGFDQSLMLQGMTAKTLSVTLPSPEHFYDIAASEVAAAWEIPIKILFGNQTGERASSEDHLEWAKHNMSRRSKMVGPNIMDIVERLVEVGVLRNMDWRLDWEDLTGASEDQRFERAGKMADINHKMAGTGELVYTDDEIRKQTGHKPLDEDQMTEFDDDGSDEPPDPTQSDEPGGPDAADQEGEDGN